MLTFYFLTFVLADNFQQCSFKDDICLAKAIEGAIHYLCKNGK